MGNFKTGNFDRHKKAKNKFKNSNSLLGQIRSMALNKLPKMLKNQRRLISEFVDLKERFEKLQEKSRDIVDIWFDPSDKYNFVLNFEQDYNAEFERQKTSNFEQDYNAEFASGTESSVLMNDDSDMIVLDE